MITMHRSSTPVRKLTLLSTALLLAAGSAGLAAAQAPEPSGASALKRTPVLHADVTAPGREATVMRVELAPHSHSGRHTHPGDEISYVVDGDAELLIDGEAPKRVGPGQAFVVKQGQIHDLRNTGSTPVHLIGVYVVDKGKPLATPAK
jgi:quercetin dioxygenase-like cupin family protein